MLEYNAKAVIAENRGIARDKDFYKRMVVVPNAPILIASTEGLGTHRVRGNHPDAGIHYCEEQEALKKAGVPL